MDNISYFKSINMQREMEIAGSFIYESAKRMKHINNLNDHCEVNLIFYTGSVGIERLQKILVTLYSENIPEDLMNIPFMKTHNPQDAEKHIAGLIGSEANDNQKSLLGHFTEYYNSLRYADFVLGKDVDDLLAVFHRFLKRRDNHFDFSGIHTLSEIEPFKKFYINTLGNLAERYYEPIYEHSHELNVYPWELRYDSTAMRVFYKYSDDETLYDRMELEDLSAREFILYLFRHDIDSNTFKIIGDLNPLDIDPADANDIISDLIAGRINNILVDTVENEYCEIGDLKERKTRKEMVECMGNPAVDLLSDDYKGDY